VKRVEGAFVEQWPALVALVLVVIGAAAIICGFLPKVDLEKLSKLVDISLKASALAVGAIWSLNRYFVQRTDQPQLKVECSVENFPVEKDARDDVSLLSFRFDILNTSKVLLRCRGVKIRIDNIILIDDQVYHEVIHQWPKTDLHPIAPIEPNSWAAVSNALACPTDVQAINLFIELHLASGGCWTWHRIQGLQRQLASEPNAGAVEGKGISSP
jgi:hypothetical protein